jgi:DNA-binding transcriptional regulator YiaG
MEFSDKVKYVRMKLELSQEMLAKELGISYSTVSRWERENRNPQMATLGRFYNFCEKKDIHFESEENK